MSWAKGVPRAYIMDEWKAPLEILQRYLTCEGRYALTYQYHVRILLHFESKELINFPYYLYKSLEKMSKMVRRNSQNPQSSLYHHGLVKMLVEAELRKINKTWDQFLGENAFIDQIPVAVEEGPSNLGK
jgi:hypothetical protein